MTVGVMQTETSEGETRGGHREPWERYVGGARAFLAVVSGRGGKGTGRDTLAAALTGHVLVALSLNTAVLAAFPATRRAAAGSLLLLAVSAWNNRRGMRSLRRASRDGSGEAYRITSWNALYTNGAERVAEGVLGCGSDLVVLFEPVSAQLDAVARGGETRWKVAFEVPGDGDDRHAGIAAYGNERVREISWRDLGGMGAVRCELGTGERTEMVVWGFRPEAPTEPERQARWRRQMKALREVVAGEVHPCMLVGDLNSSVWHEPLWQVCAAGKLRRGSRALGGTWRHPVIGWRARIDHVFASEGVAVRSMRRGDACGSDHRMLHATVQPTGK